MDSVTSAWCVFWLLDGALGLQIWRLAANKLKKKSWIRSVTQLVEKFNTGPRNPCECGIEPLDVISHGVSWLY